MKTITRILLAILIIAAAFGVVIGMCWLLGIAANAVGFMPYMIEGCGFGDIVMDGILTLCLLMLGVLMIGLVFAVAEGLR